MAPYNGTLKIPKLTLASAPVSIDIQVQYRYVERVAILFPKNAANLAGVRLLNTETQFAPAIGSTDGWIYGDNGWVEWDDEYDLGTAPPHIIRVRGYSSDDAYDRTIQVKLEVVNETLRQLMRARHETD